MPNWSIGLLIILGVEIIGLLAIRVVIGKGREK